jgi:phage portal protein BeeE
MTISAPVNLSVRQRLSGRANLPRQFGQYSLADPLAGTAARDTSVAWMTFMGIPQEGSGIDSYDKLADYSRAPADSAWVMACVQRIANAAGSVKLRVYVQHGKELVPYEDEPTQAAEDLQYLLDTANPVDMTGSQMRAYIAASRKVWGGWYLKKAKGRIFHDTQELYWLRVPDVKPKSDDGRAVNIYEYRPVRSGVSAAEDIYPSDMIRHRGLNLGSQIDMVSPLSAARYDLVTDEAAAMRTASILRRRGVPEGYWSARQGVELGPQDKSAIRRFLRQLVGPRNAGKALVAPDIEFHAIDLPEKDAQWLAGRKVSRLVVSAILGVPLALAGDVENAGFYRAPIDAQRVFWKDTMVPELDADADTFNNWLVPEFNRPKSPKLVVAYDYSKVEALKPLLKEEWAMWLAAVEGQSIVPNEFRRHFGVGPDVPWGDKPIPKTTVSIKGDTPGIAENTPVLIGADVAQPQDPDVIPDDAETLRSVRKLYGHPAVRAFVMGERLNASELFGRRVGADVQAIVEDGIRRRQSAVQIADRIAARKDAKSADVVEAVVAALRKQWPEAELDIVRQGSWTFGPEMKLKKIDFAHRPIARNPEKVEGVEAELAVGAPIAPVTIIKTDTGYTPIDGWHRLAGASKAGLKRVPAYVGEGDQEWTAALLKFNDTIPTPPDSPEEASE